MTGCAGRCRLAAQEAAQRAAGHGLPRSKGHELHQQVRKAAAPLDLCTGDEQKNRRRKVETTRRNARRTIRRETRMRKHQIELHTRIYKIWWKKKSFKQERRTYWHVHAICLVSQSIFLPERPEKLNEKSKRGCRGWLLAAACPGPLRNRSPSVRKTVQQLGLGANVCTTGRISGKLPH
jgi:hypothetical protein